MKYFACDFETTGLLAPSAAPLEVQPHIVQVGYFLLNENFKEESCGCYTVKPPIPIPAAASKVHGITDETVERCSPLYPDAIVGMMRDRCWVGQNVPFDKGCLYHACRRAGIEMPETPSLDLMDFIVARWGKRRKLTDVYADLFNEPMAKAHDALADIEATIKCLKEMM